MLRNRLAILGVCALLAAGCGGDDGNGRGGGGGGDDASTSDDIGFGDAVGKEQQGPDGVAPDGVVPEAITPDDTPSCEPPSCGFLGTRECADGTSWRECTAVGGCLRWSEPTACGSDEACQGGTCVTTTPDCSGVPDGCDVPGQRRCSADNAAVEQCNEYECPKWETFQACGAGETCIGAQCVGGSVCAQLESCVDTSCAAEAASGSDIKLAQCTLGKCKAEYEACMGPFGTGTCKDILKCAQACQDSACQQGCLKSGSYEGALQFMDVGVCLEDNCPTALQDPMGNISCIMGQCGTPLNACCGGNLMSCM